jgi:predicted Zn-dependent peptidase
VLTPSFEPGEVNIQRRLALARIASFSGTTLHLRELALGAIPGFERDSPKVNASRLLALGPEVLQRVHECTVRPEGAELVVVGPVSAQEVTEQAESAFGAWPAAFPSDRACEWPAQIAGGYSDGARLQRPELQVIYSGIDPFIVIALPGPALDSEDYLPFELISDALTRRTAGSAKRLRHVGDTYGIQSRVFTSAPNRTAVVLSGQLDPLAAQAGLRALLDDIHELEQTLGESEIEVLKRAWRSELVNSTASNPNAAEFVVRELSRQHSSEKLLNLPSEIMGVDLERCRQVAARWFSKAQPSIVVATRTREFARGLGIDAHVQELFWNDK